MEEGGEPSLVTITVEDILRWYFSIDDVLFMSGFLVIMFGMGARKSYKAKIDRSIFFKHQRKHDAQHHASYLVHMAVALTFAAVGIQRIFQLI